MNETLLRNWVRKMLLEQQGEQPVSYKPSCAYEIKINTMLQNAGLRDQYTPGSTPGFCFGTDSGADGKFQGPDGTPYNLEMKDGKSQAAVAMEEPLREEVLELISKLEGYNTVPYITGLINAQLSTGNMKGLNCGRSLCPPNLNLTPADVNGLAQQIQAAQAPEIRALKEALQKPGSELPNFTLYYYFGRTEKAEQDLGISDVPPVGQPSTMDTGKWTAHYNSSNTYYIQIGGSGLFYMGSDPAGLEVPAFDGSVTLGSRIRFKASSGNSPIGGRGNNTYVTESGQEITLGGRRFEVTPTVDLRAGGSSPINLDTDAGINALREKLGYGAVNENTIRKLVRQVLLESTAGHVYEESLINSFNTNAQNSWCVFQPAPNLSYDIGVVNKASGATEAKIEVKLDKNAQLGKISKDTFSSLKYVVGGEIVFEFADGIDESNIDIVNTMMTFINKADGVVLDKLNTFFTTAVNVLVDKQPMVVRPGTVIDLTKTIHIPSEIDPNKERAKKGYTVSPARDAQGNVVPKQFSSFKTGVKFSSSQMINYLAKKKDYFILGDGGTAPVGGICSIGSDPLKLGLSAVSLGDVAVEIRWKDSGNKTVVDGITYKGNTFTFESRGGDVSTAAGKRFESGQDLVAIFNPPPAAPASTSEDL